VSAKSDETYAGISSEAVRAKTGKGWAEWFAILDKSGAAKWTHKEIAKHLHELGCGDWWSQMVTVGYEQARGLRVKHQVADGFSASGSKTIATPITKLFAAWTDAKSRAKWLPKGEFTIRKRTVNRSLRLTWGDGSHVDVMFYAKASEKSQVTIEQRKLSGVKDVERVKKFWGAALSRLKDMLESYGAEPPAGKAKPSSKSLRKR
jgi:hypothetical protein